MISGGFSLEVFKQWAPDEVNLVTLPGYCVAGTVGHRLMSAKTPTQVNIDQNTKIDVRCQIHQLSFSPHTDAKGIMDLIKFLSPKHVILVHGEKPKMESLKGKIESDFDMQCHVPANNETLSIPSTHYVKADASSDFLKSTWSPNFKFVTERSRGNLISDDMDMISKPVLPVCDDRVAEGILTMGKHQNPKIVHLKELVHVSGLETHDVQFALCFPVQITKMDEQQQLIPVSQESLPCLHQLYLKLSNNFSEATIQESDQNLQIESFIVSVCSKEKCPHRMNDGPDCNLKQFIFAADGQQQMRSLLGMLFHL